MTRIIRTYPGAAIAAGSIGGLISAFFKLGWEVPFPPRLPGRIPEPMVLITMFTHHPTPVWQSYIIHFAFSFLSGAAYGGLVEFFPIVAVGMGVGFGLAIWVGAHEIVMPAMGLTPPVWKLPASEQLSEFFGHAVWGFVIEVFRHDFRARFVKSAPVVLAPSDAQSAGVRVPVSA
ncbi:MAG: DUF1440 domain-containing protein [Candidatus Baltobacteraceae bacterium]|jgi:putative membrane protein